MAQQNKTTETDASVETFLDAVAHPVRRRDAQTLRALMERVTGEPARMWGTAIVGFGTHHYVYESGREGDMPVAGFSPRAAASTVYVADGFDAYGDLLAALGPYRLGKSCLYLKDLDAIDAGVLAELVGRSATTVRGWSAG